VRRALALAVALTLPACTTGVRRAQPTPTPSPSSSSATPSATASASATATADTCPAAYAMPDPKRPKIRLTFDLSDDGTVVTGTEHVAFTPDLAVEELVFRTWPNAPGSAENGGRLEVTKASLPMTVEDAGAGEDAPGTLVRLALPSRSPAGTTVTADLSFRLTLPKSGVERYGHNATASWWASGHPLLAWQRGVGWALEPAVGILGETAVSETADYDVTVTAPERLTVVGSGRTGVHSGSGPRRTWHFTNPYARDVAVVAGTFVTESFAVERVPVQIAVDAALDPRTTLGPVRANVTLAMKEFTGRFGRFPYPSLTVVALKPIGGAGIEYPGLIFVGSRRYDLVVTHEMAHEWFYGLVGNNQATEPWLDEAFATYGEALVNDVDYSGSLDNDGDVNEPMTYWDKHSKSYGAVVYAKGAAALLAARETGPVAFDRAIRCYVNANAYGIATARDLGGALSGLPEAYTVLRRAGALK